VVDSKPGPDASLLFPPADADAYADERLVAGENKDVGRVDITPAHVTTSITTSGRGNEKILVVEDQPEIRSLIRRILLLEGYLIEEATSGKHALELAVAPDSGFDLVLTDVSMPEMTGLEFGQRLASLHPTLPVLYMSGHTDWMPRTMQISEDGTGTRQIFLVLEKPFTIAQLLSKVRALLDNLPPTLQ
jgi:CheY-like chemotaxis protein